MPDTPLVEDVIAAIPEYAGRVVSVEPIAAGLTNRNYRVTIDDEVVFVRIPGAGTELLAVDRANELHNTRAAALAGVGPQVLHHVPASNALVLEWIPGATMSNSTFQRGGEAERVARVLQRLHAGPRFRDDFDMFRLS